jgi:hypothetical protein
MKQVAIDRFIEIDKLNKEKKIDSDIYLILSILIMFEDYEETNKKRITYNDFKEVIINANNQRKV